MAQQVRVQPCSRQVCGAVRVVSHACTRCSAKSSATHLPSTQSEQETSFQATSMPSTSSKPLYTTLEAPRPMQWNCMQYERQRHANLHWPLIVWACPSFGSCKAWCCVQTPAPGMQLQECTRGCTLQAAGWGVTHQQQRPKWPKHGPAGDVQVSPACIRPILTLVYLLPGSCRLAKLSRLG